MILAILTDKNCACNFTMLELRRVHVDLITMYIILNNVINICANITITWTQIPLLWLCEYKLEESHETLLWP